RVDAIFRATCPDLPIPVTTTRPCAARIRSTAAAKLPLRPSRSAAASASTPPPSASKVRRADAIAACARSLVALAGFGLAMGVLVARKGLFVRLEASDLLTPADGPNLISREFSLPRGPGVLWQVRCQRQRRQYGGAARPRCLRRAPARAP